MHRAGFCPVRRNQPAPVCVPFGVQCQRFITHGPRPVKIGRDTKMSSIIYLVGLVVVVLFVLSLLGLR
jgi:hypothetical protein